MAALKLNPKKKRQDEVHGLELSKTTIRKVRKTSVLLQGKCWSFLTILVLDAVLVYMCYMN